MYARIIHSQMSKEKVRSAGLQGGSVLHREWSYLLFGSCVVRKEEVWGGL